MAKTQFTSPASAADEEFSTRQLLVNVNARMTKVAVMTSAVSVSLVLILFLFLPLKKSVPYVVQVNKDTGEVSVPASQVSTAFNPSWDNKAFFIRRWITDLFTINQYLTVRITDPRAQLFLRGQNAIGEYQAFRSDDATFSRLVADPTLTRDAAVVNLTQIAGTENGAVAQVQLTTHTGGKETVETKLITLYYVTLPSTNVADLANNPIGLYVTDFKVSQKE
jgi:type IV secretory pathway component VirB8